MTKLAETLMTPEEFEATMVYFPTRVGNSREIAQAYHVLGQPATKVAEQFDCSKQNVVKVLARFAKAYERYNQVRRHLNAADARKVKEIESLKTTIAEKTVSSPAKTPAKKAPAKVPAKKAPAKKTPAKKAPAPKKK
ncbi:DNA anti-recombination protein RmuC [Variovorax boronicumulans]|uniref:DNA anti-recombination protein RmuC n=1 Tax=Variovorax boronicumulans TaxID=436515 RepID=A0AAW8DDA1_9BURK|nr:hypothetical protein [Variovorax boronicumulans]MDP9897335.1 DNA anti-recombination protein RmuC [Variovorax boronicumulans]MDQ0057431.1 DNA anti-recombination protein RmuC [Variovorax boronicumulans]